MNKEKLISELKPLFSKIEVLETCTSTNTLMRRRIQDNDISDVIISECQTSGRGRLGKSFVSQKEKGIYVSFLYKSEMNMNVIPLTSLTAVFCAEAIEKVIGKPVGIKWVNDLFLNGRKLGGILCEKTGEYVIIGIGINTNYTNNDFPEEIGNIATSVLIETGKSIRNEILIVEIAKSIRKMLNEFPNCEDKYSEYVKRSVVLDKEIHFVLNGEEKTGKAIAVNSDYSLRINTHGEELNLSSSEISLGSHNFSK